MLHYCTPENKVKMSFIINKTHYQPVQGCNNVILVRKIIIIIHHYNFLTIMMIEALTFSFFQERNAWRAQ